MTVYILEGPDGAGKSTLANKLQAHSDSLGRSAVIHHNGPPEPGTNLFYHYVEQVALITSPKYRLQYPKMDHIFDRLHVGELIYGPIFRQVSQLSRKQADAIDDYLYDIGAICVFVTAPIPAIIARVANRGDKMISGNQQLTEICNEYTSYMAFRTNWIRWDTTKQGKVFL